MMDSALEAAYRNTTYVVEHPAGDFGIRLGVPCARLGAPLREHGVTAWVYVTAYNPRSQPLPQVENAARHARLLAHVRNLRLVTFAGRGKPDCGDWMPEESLLILGLDEDAAVALGAVFEQSAVVVGKVGGLAELRWC